MTPSILTKPYPRNTDGKCFALGPRLVVYACKLSTGEMKPGGPGDQGQTTQ